MTDLEIIRRGMEKRGFVFSSKSICIGCKRELSWAISPKGKIVPFTAETMQPHQKICHQAFTVDLGKPKGQMWRRRG
jgi:hypothetical protein